MDRYELSSREPRTVQSELLEALRKEGIKDLDGLASSAISQMSKEGKFDPKLGAVLVGDWYVLVS